MSPRSPTATVKGPVLFSSTRRPAESCCESVTQGIDGPKQIVLDRLGNVYFDNIFGKITLYTSGAERLIRTISLGVKNPSAIALDRHDNLYVANQWSRNPQNITVYSNGGAHFVRTMYLPAAASDMAFDATNNLLVASPNHNNVTVYAPNSDRVLRVIRDGVRSPQSVAISREVLYIGNGEDTTAVYSLKTGKLVRVLPDEAVSAAFDRGGRVYLSNWKTVAIYSNGGKKLLGRIDKRAASVVVDPHRGPGS
jgi:sugar lactone lactonase YvrE